MKTEMLIETIAQNNNGIIKTSDIVKYNIRKEYLQKAVEAGIITRKIRGIYHLSDQIVDEYYILQQRCSKGVYSYGTALYFHGLSNRVPNVVSLTIPQGYNTSSIVKDYDNIRFHYVQKDIYEIGINEIKSPQGQIVKIYDKERTICDIIKNRNDMDTQIYIQGIKDYFRCKDKNVRRLIKYAQKLNIEDKVRVYMEVLM